MRVTDLLGRANDHDEEMAKVCVPLQIGTANGRGGQARVYVLHPGIESPLRPWAKVTEAWGTGTGHRRRDGYATETCCLPKPSSRIILVSVFFRPNQVGIRCAGVICPELLLMK